MQYYAFAQTEKGNFRENNEDCILVCDKALTDGEISKTICSPFLTAVCDGVGGENGGEVASFYVSTSLGKLEEFGPKKISEHIKNLDTDLIAYGNENKDMFGLQTTLCCLLATEDDRLFCINSGDSRLFLYKDKKCVQISHDHSVVQELVDKGEISKEEAKTHPQKHIITSSIGNPYEEPTIDITEISQKLNEDDAVIICSDGVSDYVWESEIEVAFGLDISFDEKIKALLQLALERGSTDNLSIVGIKIN